MVTLLARRRSRGTELIDVARPRTRFRPQPGCVAVRIGGACTIVDRHTNTNTNTQANTHARRNTHTLTHTLTHSQTKIHTDTTTNQVTHTGRTPVPLHATGGWQPVTGVTHMVGTVTRCPVRTSRLGRAHRRPPLLHWCSRTLARRCSSGSTGPSSQ